jgi:hypothetical protein
LMSNCMRADPTGSIPDSYGICLTFVGFRGLNGNRCVARIVPTPNAAHTTAKIRTG